MTACHTILFGGAQRRGGGHAIHDSLLQMSTNSAPSRLSWRPNQQPQVAACMPGGTGFISPSARGHPGADEFCRLVTFDGMLQDWLYGADAGEEVQVMTELPQGLRKEIALSINQPLFKRLNFFASFPEGVIASIASHMAPLQVPSSCCCCL